MRDSRAHNARTNAATIAVVLVLTGGLVLLAGCTTPRKTGASSSSPAAHSWIVVSKWSTNDTTTVEAIDPDSGDRASLPQQPGSVAWIRVTRDGAVLIRYDHERSEPASPFPDTYTYVAWVPGERSRVVTIAALAGEGEPFRPIGAGNDADLESSSGSALFSWVRHGEQLLDGRTEVVETDLRTGAVRSLILTSGVAGDWVSDTVLCVSPQGDRALVWNSTVFIEDQPDFPTRMRLVDYPSLRVLRTFPEVLTPPDYTRWSPDGRQVAMGGFSGTLRVIDFSADEASSSLTLALPDSLDVGGWDVDGRFWIRQRTEDGNSRLQSVEVVNGKLQLGPSILLPVSVMATSASPTDGGRFAVLGVDGSVWIVARYRAPQRVRDGDTEVSTAYSGVAWVR